MLSIVSMQHGDQPYLSFRYVQANFNALLKAELLQSKSLMVRMNYVCLFLCTFVFLIFNIENLKGKEHKDSLIFIINLFGLFFINTCSQSYAMGLPMRFVLNFMTAYHILLVRNKTRKPCFYCIYCLSLSFKITSYYVDIYRVYHCTNSYAFCY